MKKIKIYLKPYEVELFKKFVQYQGLWEELFKIRGGKAILHFDKNGTIRKAEADHILWVKEKTTRHFKSNKL